MKKTLYSINVLFLAFIVLFLSTSAPRSEFYEYVDKNGVKCFTDDQGRVPENQKKKSWSTKKNMMVFLMKKKQKN